MSTVNVYVYVNSDHFGNYDSDGIEDGDMTKWSFLYEEPEEYRDCKIYIFRQETSPDKYYAHMYQCPRPLGDYASGNPEDPPPVPDFDPDWYTLANIQFEDWDDYVNGATYNAGIEGFTKDSKDYLFKATFDDESDDWGAPIPLTVEEQE